jgi:RNA polymerase sigma-70 factor (ECF subfamily)
MVSDEPIDEQLEDNSGDPDKGSVEEPTSATYSSASGLRGRRSKDLTTEEARERERENAQDLALFRQFRSTTDPAASREAYTQLYLKYRQRVYAYCLRVLCDEDEAQDLFQEVFVRVYERAHQFEEQRSLGGWIFTIAHNLCLNKIRDRKPNTMLEDVTLSVTPAEDYGDSWKERIQWALEQIPLDYREAFVLREYEGLSYQEIADVLHTTLPAVKSRIYRSKERLRELLEPYYNDNA